MRYFLITFLTLVFASPVFAGQLEDGLLAYSHQDFQTAVKLLQPLADQGNERAQWRMGDLYRRGEGVTKDRKEALSWYIKAAEHNPEMTSAEKSAEKGDPDSQYALGTFFRCLPDQIGYCEMKKWLQLAMEQGNWRAQDDLWDYELSGKERLYVPKDEVQSCRVPAEKSASKVMKSPAGAPTWAKIGRGCLKM